MLEAALENTVGCRCYDAALMASDLFARDWKRSALCVCGSVALVVSLACGFTTFFTRIFARGDGEERD